MGIGAGIVLIAIGAILAFATHVSGGGFVNIHLVGWILMGAGALGVLLSLAFWSSWGGGGVVRRDVAPPANPPGTGPPAY